MYYWARSELINSSPSSSSPGRIGQPTWLTDKSSGIYQYYQYFNLSTTMINYDTKIIKIRYAYAYIMHILEMIDKF